MAIFGVFRNQAQDEIHVESGRKQFGGEGAHLAAEGGRWGDGAEGCAADAGVDEFAGEEACDVGQTLGTGVAVNERDQVGGRRA